MNKRKATLKQWQLIPYPWILYLNPPQKRSPRLITNYIIYSRTKFNGSWSSKGCSVVGKSCSCNHLTSFAILLETKEHQVKAFILIMILIIIIIIIIITANTAAFSQSGSLPAEIRVISASNIGQAASTGKIPLTLYEKCCGGFKIFSIELADV